MFARRVVQEDFVKAADRTVADGAWDVCDLARVVASRPERLEAVATSQMSARDCGTDSLVHEILETDRAARKVLHERLLTVRRSRPLGKEAD